jgi:hypothetical protein
MIRVAITQEALAALVRMRPPGTVDYEPQTNAKGERLIWLERSSADKLGAMRGPGESCSVLSCS